MTISINDSVQKHSLNPLKNTPIQEGKESFGSVFEMHNDTEKLISSLQKFMSLVSQLFQTLDNSFKNENYVKKCSCEHASRPENGEESFVLEQFHLHADFYSEVYHQSGNKVHQTKMHMEIDIVMIHYESHKTKHPNHPIHSGFNRLAEVLQAIKDSFIEKPVELEALEELEEKEEIIVKKSIEAEEQLAEELKEEAMKDENTIIEVEENEKLAAAAAAAENNRAVNDSKSIFEDIKPDSDTLISNIAEKEKDVLINPLDLTSPEQNEEDQALATIQRDIANTIKAQNILPGLGF